MEALPCEQESETSHGPHGEIVCGREINECRGGKEPKTKLKKEWIASKRAEQRSQTTVTDAWVEEQKEQKPSMA